MEETKLTVLTANSGVGVIMNREAARAAEPFPAEFTNVFPWPSAVVIAIHTYGTGRF